MDSAALILLLITTFLFLRSIHLWDPERRRRRRVYPISWNNNRDVPLPCPSFLLSFYRGQRAGADERAETGPPPPAPRHPSVFLSRAPGSIPRQARSQLGTDGWLTGGARAGLEGQCPTLNDTQTSSTAGDTRTRHPASQGERKKEGLRGTGTTKEIFRGTLWNAES